MKSSYSIQTLITIVVYSLFISSCNNQNNTANKTNDPKIDTTIKIGLQIWATQNLDVVNFRNGDAIPEAETVEEWRKAEKEKTPAWCYYKNEAENGKKYGKLYNWYAVKDSRGLAPKGYHVPSSVEWESLVSALGGRTVAGIKLKSKSDWSEGGNGTNESGFLGLPGGARYDFGPFNDLGYSAIWWTTSQQEIMIGLNGLIWYSDNFVYTDNTNGPGAGLSVRCLKD